MWAPGMYMPKKRAKPACRNRWFSVGEVGWPKWVCKSQGTKQTPPPPPTPQSAQIGVPKSTVLGRGGRVAEWACKSQGAKPNTPSPSPGPTPESFENTKTLKTLSKRDSRALTPFIRTRRGEIDPFASLFGHWLTQTQSQVCSRNAKARTQGLAAPCSRLGLTSVLHFRVCNVALSTLRAAVARSRGIRKQTRANLEEVSSPTTLSWEQAAQVASSTTRPLSRCRNIP